MNELGVWLHVLEGVVYIDHMTTFLWATIASIQRKSL